MRTAFRLGLLTALSLTFSAAAQTRRPWAEPAFAAAPVALAQEAATVASDEADDAIILLEEGRYLYDADGRSTYTWRMVYRILTPRGAEGWSSTQVRWEPWHQERPTLRARVVTADGSEHWLDPLTIGEFPVAETDSDTYHDARILRAPLPAVAVGAVVESEIVVRETAPFFDRGNVRYFYFGSSVPTLESHLVIDAPADLPLHRITRLMPGLEPKREEADGRVRWSYDAGRLEPVPTIDGLIPSELPQTPYVAFSTGGSWAEVAARYAQIVEEQIASARVEDVAREAIRGAKTRDEKITRLLERLRRDVRYTAIEFGAAAIVPRTPAETLQRKYGDCKDQAALFVALLRASDIEAHVALLDTGPGPDIERELPGMGVFDHAIAYLPGDPPLWVDTTHEFARPNQLPPPDQDRLALIAAPGTRDLLRTPAPTPAENRIVLTREFFLTDEGPARVVETTEVWGAGELSYRSFYAQAKPDEVREGFKNYASSAFLTEDVGNFEIGDAADLSRPFRLRFEAQKSRRAWAQYADAGVAILLPPIFERLPDTFTEKKEEDEEKKEPESREPKKLTPPDADLVLYEPFLTEWHYRIVPTPGLVPRPLPPSGTDALGPATLTREFKSADGSTVLVTLRLDTGKRRLTSAEVAELRRGVQQVLEAEPILVRFENVGEAHLEAGRIREALGEFRRLAGLHPGEASHHTQIARALLAGGLGEPARAEARRAVELAPDSVKAHNTLGWVLQHDLIGRRFGKGFDLEGAVAAYRRAIELALEPAESQGSRADLAILLEHNPDGIRYAAGARLDDAIAEYKKMDDLEPSAPLFNNLPLALFWARRFDDLKQFLRAKHRPPQLHHVYLAAVAADEGGSPALAEATTLITSADARLRSLLQAGYMLRELRLYPPAAELIAAGASSSQNPTEAMRQANQLVGLQHNEDLTFPEADPRSVVKLMLRDLMLEKPVRELAPFFTREAGKAVANGTMEQLENLSRGWRLGNRSAGLSAPMVTDLIVPDLTIGVEGDDAVGYRLRKAAALVSGGPREVFYVVKEDGSYRILGMNSELAFVATEVLRRIKAGNLTGAQRLLDWARDERPAGGGDDPLAGSFFARFWSKDANPTAEAMTLAAAALLLESKETVDQAVFILQPARERAGANDRMRFDLVLMRAFMQLERFEEALASARALLAAYPASDGAFSYLIATLARLHRWDEVEKEARQRLERLPDDPDALRQLVQLAQRRNNFAEATRLHQRVVDIGKAEAGDYNNIAWQALFEGTVTEKAFAAAQKAIGLSQTQDSGILHTLACLYAEVGRIKEAREVILRAMDVGRMEEPNEAFWYVFGRIAEQFGEQQAALALYRKAIPEKSEEDPFLSTTELTQKRIALLESAATKEKQQAQKPSPQN